MSASNPELIPLIYRHLKEHGFHTAAEELQKHSLQHEAPTSASLLDIYSSWLKTSKRKPKSATSKRSTPDKKQTTPKKAAQKKKTDKTAKQSGSPNKKSPTKRKKDDGKATKTNVKSTKSKTDKKKADDGEDSDSDSSLDVEKWKKLVEQMTDADRAKVDAFDALAAPEPKKPRVRKPRAKPKPKTETPTDGQNQQSNTPDKSTEDVFAKSSPTKKSRSKKVAPVAALDDQPPEQNIETPFADVTSTPKQSPKKEKRKATTDPTTESKRKKKKAATPDVIINATDGDDLTGKTVANNKYIKTINQTEIKLTKGIQENTDNHQTEPKKKKKKDITQNTITAKASSGQVPIDKNVDTNKELTKGSQENTTNLPTEPKKKKKKKKKAIEEEVKETADSHVSVDQNVEKNAMGLNSNLVTEDISSSLNTANTDSKENIKKKKKKQGKAKEDTETVIESKVNSVITDEPCQDTEEPCQDTEEMAPKKKKKKKDKFKAESETVQQETVIAETVEENAQEITVKKKSKKKKKENQEHLGTEGDKTQMTPESDGKAPEETPDPTSTPQTPGSKRKKHKSPTEELAQVDAVSQIEESETPKKKKKKSSKSKETES